jgi:hypothetical protein
MVHSWIHIKNDKLSDKCLNHRVCRLFRSKSASFYGDYDLDIYIGTKSDYKSLQNVVQKVITKGRGWIGNCSLEDEVHMSNTSMSSILNEFGSINSYQMHKFVPPKDKFVMKQVTHYRKDGNFKMIACETEHMYYVFCFATS